MRFYGGQRNITPYFAQLKRPLKQYFIAFSAIFFILLQFILSILRENVVIFWKLWRCDSIIVRKNAQKMVWLTRALCNDASYSNCVTKCQNVSDSHHFISKLKTFDALSRHGVIFSFSRLFCMWRNLREKLGGAIGEIGNCVFMISGTWVIKEATPFGKRLQKRRMDDKNPAAFWRPLTVLIIALLLIMLLLSSSEGHLQQLKSTLIFLMKTRITWSTWEQIGGHEIALFILE